MEQTLDAAELPVKLFAYTACFRSEAGSWGQDVKGIKRMHQFDKIEMNAVCLPDQSSALYEEFGQINEWLLQKLALPYRVVDKCHGDAGYLASHRQRDMEVWMSGAGEFMEVMTDTNATDYQARRLNIRYKGASGRGFCHLVNDTGCAMEPAADRHFGQLSAARRLSAGPRSLATGHKEKRPATERCVMGERLDGRVIAAQVQEELRADIARLQQEHGLVPGLAVVLVGDDPASLSYVRAKGRACESLGIHSVQIDLPANATTEDVLATVERLNADDAIHGILIQLPLPGQDEQQVLNAIDPDKDVDGLHPVNLGRLVRQEECFWPCTPHGGLADPQPQRGRGGWPARGRGRPEHPRGTARSHLAGAQGGRGQCHSDLVPHRHSRPRAPYAPSGHSSGGGWISPWDHGGYGQRGCSGNRRRHQPSGRPFARTRLAARRRRGLQTGAPESPRDHPRAQRSRADDDRAVAL